MLYCLPILRNPLQQHFRVMSGNKAFLKMEDSELKNLFQIKNAHRG